MSGFEKEELRTRMQGMTVEEKQLAARMLPDGILLEELCRRYTDLLETVKNVNQAVNK